MNDVISIVQPLLIGLAVGFAFFGGLWLTVRHLETMNNPGLVIFLSSFLRIALAMTAFYFVSRGGLSVIAWCIAGFLTARFLFIKEVRNRESSSTSQ
jgi:F1F0 ATPase subunit 2